MINEKEGDVYKDEIIQLNTFDLLSNIKNS